MFYHIYNLQLFKETSKVNVKVNSISHTINELLDWN